MIQFQAAVWRKEESYLKRCGPDLHQSTGLIPLAIVEIPLLNIYDILDTLWYNWRVSFNQYLLGSMKRRKSGEVKKETGWSSVECVPCGFLSPCAEIVFLKELSEHEWQVKKACLLSAHHVDRPKKSIYPVLTEGPRFNICETSRVANHGWHILGCRPSICPLESRHLGSTASYREPMGMKYSCCVAQQPDLSGAWLDQLSGHRCTATLEMRAWTAGSKCLPHPTPASPKGMWNEGGGGTLVWLVYHKM